MLNNVVDGFDQAAAGTVRASVYVGDTQSRRHGKR